MIFQELKRLYPEFLVVGAAKSGTSSLDLYLRNHRDIFMPKLTKELNFFHLKGHESKRAILKRNPYLPTNILSYLGFFVGKSSHQISGECSPSYLYYYNDTISNIKELHPNWEDLKIVIILREPIDKIWSHYKFVKMRNNDPENLNLEESIKREEQRLDDPNLLPGVFYINNTRYFKQVKAYLDNFKHVKIIKFDELKKHPDKVVNDLLLFLNLENNIFIDTSKKHNVSKKTFVYKNKFLENFFQNMPKPINSVIPTKLKTLSKKEEQLSMATKIHLAQIFQEEITELQKITNIDFNDWLQVYRKILNN